MDAQLLRGSWSLPAAAPLRASSCWSPPAASQRPRPARQLVQINPGRRDVYLVQAGTRGAHCHEGGADQSPEDVDEPDLVGGASILV